MSWWDRLLPTVTSRICAVLFIDILAFALIVPVLPNMVLQMVGNDVGMAAWVQGMASGLDGGLKFFIQPLLGRLSDSVGRKPVLCYSLVVSCLAFGLYVFSPSVTTLFISHALHGVSQCTFLMCMSAITDDAHDPDDPSKLTHSFGLVGVALGVAFVVGPICGGWLSQIAGFQAVYALSTTLFVLTLWAWAVLLPETLPVEKRRPMVWSEAVPFRSGIDLFGKIKGLGLVSFAYFLCSLTVGVYNVWILFSTVQFGWDILMAGVLLSLNGFVVVVGQGFVLRQVCPAYCDEATLCVISYFSHAVLFFLVAASPTGAHMLFVILIMGVPSALGEPSMKSIMAHIVSKEEQGALQGVMGSVYVLAGAISPVVYSALFRYGISKEMRDWNPHPCVEGYFPPEEIRHQPNPCGGLPQLPFIAQAVVFVLATRLMSYAFTRIHLRRDVDVEVTDLHSELSLIHKA